MSGFSVILATEQTTERDIMPDIKIPEPTLPHPIAGYWSSDNADKLLSWDFVSQRMSAAKSYWIATTIPVGSRHAVAGWGVWLGDALDFGGSEDSGWSR
jgi:hypothetical protein